MLRWDYDFGDLISIGLEVDPEQRRIVSEGGHVLTPWPVLDSADRYPRGGKVPFLVDQTGNPVMVPCVFEVAPWDEARIEQLRRYASREMNDAYFTWPSYLTAGEQPQFLSVYLDVPTEDHVMRIWDGLPVDLDDADVKELQLGFSTMFDDTGITDQMGYYEDVASGDWMPDLPGYEPQEYDDFEAADATAAQERFDELLAKGLVTQDGQITALHTAPVEKYLPDPQIAWPWRAHLAASEYAWKRIYRVMSQDNHPLIELERYFNPWE